MAEYDEKQDRALREVLAGEGKSVLYKQFPVGDMSEGVQDAFGIVLEEMIERNKFERTISHQVRRPDLTLDKMLGEKIEAHAPACNAENCCRSVGMSRAYYGEASRAVLQVTCSYDTPTDEEEAMRQEGRCQRIQGRMEKAFGEYITNTAIEIREAQARIQSAEEEIEYQNAQLDTLLTRDAPVTIDR